MIYVEKTGICECYDVGASRVVTYKTFIASVTVIEGVFKGQRRVHDTQTLKCALHVTRATDC